MASRKGPRRLPQDPSDHAHGERAVTVEPMGQGLAGNVCHDEPWHTLRRCDNTAPLHHAPDAFERPQHGGLLGERLCIHALGHLDRDLGCTPCVSLSNETHADQYGR